MPIRCVCPNGHPLRVKDQLAGQTGQCPKCGATFTAPTLAGPSLADQPASPQPSDAAPASNATATAPPQSPPLPPLPALGGASTDPDAVEWRVAMPGGEQFGPTVPTIFAQWIVSGRVPPDSLVWRSGWTEWRTVTTVADELPAPLPVNFAAEAPPAAVPPPLPDQSDPLTKAATSGDSSATEPTVSATSAEKPRVAITRKQRKPTTVDGYQQRRERQARRRRHFTIALAVLCVGLAAMLIWVSQAVPPESLPQLP